MIAMLLGIDATILVSVLLGMGLLVVEFIHNTT